MKPEIPLGKIVPIDQKYYKCVLGTTTCGNCDLAQKPGCYSVGPCTKVTRTDSKYVMFKEVDNVVLKLFRDWVDTGDVAPMTRNQAEFAEWLLENREHVDKIGSYGKIFNSITKFLKNNRSKPNNHEN